MGNNISNQNNTAIENDTQKQNVFHLLDGTPLIGYPKQQPDIVEDNSMQLDTTGQYLTIGRKKPTPIPQKTVSDEEKQLFLDNAFLFLDNRERILSDSRMFLAPVKIQSGLAYSGTSGFNNPTLGVYIEWWMTCGPAIVDRYRDMPWLVYHIAGSPLSGSNHCGIVNQRGERESKTILPFIKLWRPFVDINNRYSKAKAMYEAYTLQEVVERLINEKTDEGNAERIIFLQRHEIKALHEELEEKEKQYKKRMKEVRRDLLAALFEPKLNQLKQWYVDSTKEQAIQIEKLNEMLQQKEQLRKKFRSGELSNVAYQKSLTPLKKKIFAQEDIIRNVRVKMLAEILPAINNKFGLPYLFTEQEVIDYLENNKTAKQ